MRARHGAGFRSSTPIVILLIGLILILYLLFLTPAEREALLSGGQTPGGTYRPGPGTGPGPAVSGGVLLMDKYLGTLLVKGTGTIEHPLPSTTVFTAVNTEELKFIDSMIVKQGAFSKQEGTLTFRADTTASKNYLLTFNVDTAKGPLLIKLNGQTIFEREVTTRSPEPIKLPQEHLLAENTLTFATGTAGWSFWDANEYSLRNILVSADIQNFQAATSEQHFTITPDEQQRMDKGRLEFVPQCDAKKAGRLSIHVNGELLYSGLIDCGTLMRLDVPKDKLAIGDNRVGFTASQGSYTVDRAKVISIMKEEEYPTYYFNLPPDMFAQANVFAGRVVVTLRFSEGNNLKKGVIVVNGFKDTFQTQSYYYQATLDPNILMPNANSIQIQPVGTTLNIPELRVEMYG